MTTPASWLSPTQHPPGRPRVGAPAGTAPRRPREPGVALGDPVGDSDWDRDLAGCAGATFFHGSAWARVLRDAYGLEPVYVMRRETNRIASLLPLMDVQSWLTGRRGVSLPFTDEVAPLCADQRSFDLLLNTAQAIAVERRWRHLECRGGGRFFPGASPSVSFLGHRLDLRHGADALFDQFESSTRRAVRKAELGGVSVEFSTDASAVRTFHGLLCQTRRRHGVPPQPLAFFEQIHRHVIARGQGCVVLARAGRRAVAGAVYFQYGGVATYKYGASDQRYQDLRANNLVMWSAIRHFADHAFDTLEFGRTSRSNAGLRKFKLGWGTREYPIDYVRRAVGSGAYLKTADAAAGWHTQAMAVLPPPIFQLVGSLLYKHLA